MPYCHIPCYGALFGPQLFGHGTRVESHKSFGQKGSPRINSGPPLPRSHLESKLKVNSLSKQFCSFVLNSVFVWACNTCRRIIFLERHKEDRFFLCTECLFV